MAKYGTAALALLVSLLAQKASADCNQDLVGGVYCPYTDVSSVAQRINDDSSKLGDIVDPKDDPTTLQNLSDGLEFFNKDSIVRGFPSYVKTSSDTMKRYQKFYGETYGPHMVLQAALAVPLGELQYSGPALSHDFTIQKGTPYVISEEIAKKTAQYTTTMIEMFQLLEETVMTIGLGCTGIVNPGADPACEDALALWDQAAAVQTGVHALAQKRCENYSTCGYFTSSINEDETDIALSNHKTLMLFQHGAEAVRSGDIVAVKTFIKMIESATAVPFIQGTLRYSQKISGYTIEEKAKEFAEGSAFATGILPKVYECNQAVATLIDEKFQITDGNESSDDPSDYLAAVRSVYGCIGVTCEDIGGLIESGSTYYEGFGPCKSSYGNYIITH